MNVRQLPAGHEDLIRLIRKWGDVTTIGQYLDLMSCILEAVDLPNGDPRLVTNTRKPRDLHLMPATIGMRFVLAFDRRRESVFMILPYWYEHGHALCEATGRFSNMAGEKDMPPAYDLIRNLSALQENEVLLKDWKIAARFEISRQSRSTFRKHHKPAVYEAARDPAYREVVFGQAFDDSEIL
ncbi:hypothetical protein [Deinococcus sp. S9]|uniref:hypothetical protein n=1 Tax=Deinococcus sp. S9 TaxID=2545754 RepID=UPI0010558BF9|nr:hypothetical protein [Deinococcus sp. S9]TDE85284.1 hypothetical protein E0686_12750 [Deinococcus sp. S9]